SAASAPRITPRAATVAAAPDLTPNATWRDALAAEHTATVNPPPGSFCQVRLLQRQRSHRDTEPQRFEVDVAERSSGAEASREALLAHGNQESLCLCGSVARLPLRWPLRGPLLSRRTCSRLRG